MFLFFDATLRVLDLALEFFVKNVLKGFMAISIISIKNPIGHTHPQKNLPKIKVRKIITRMGIKNFRLKWVRNIRGSYLKNGLKMVLKGSRDLK